VGEPISSKKNVQIMEEKRREEKEREGKWFQTFSASFFRKRVES